MHCVGGKQSEALERGLTYNALNDLEFRGLIANAKCGGPVGVKCNSACVLNVFYVGESLKDDKIGFNKKSRKSRRRRIKNGFIKHGWEEYFQQVVDGDCNTYTDISDGEDDDDGNTNQMDGMKNDDYEEEEDEEDYIKKKKPSDEANRKPAAVATSKPNARTGRTARAAAKKTKYNLGSDSDDDSDAEASDDDSDIDSEDER